jgi:phage virion morphogenesis protein
MQGVRIITGWDGLAPMMASLAALRPGGARWPGVLRAVGEGLLWTTQQRFKAETDPAGQKWKPLSPAYAAAKRGPRILTESGALYRDVHYQLVGSDAVAVGAMLPYAAIHQFGGVIRPRSAKALVFRLGPRLVRARKVTIPARPYLGFGRADREMVEEVVQGFFQRAMARGAKGA